MPAALVGFSGGVDSTYLLALAAEALGARVAAVTADSPSLSRASLDEAIAFCATRGIRHYVVATDEFEVPEYRANDGRRCYHCKAALLRAMQTLRAAAGGQTLLLGTIADDLGDVRPGLVAAAEAGALAPLADAGLRKTEVRLRSRARLLPTSDRPAEPCLSSRVPYGEPVTPEAVRMIEAAEASLHRAGFRECRARHHRIGGASGALRGYLCRIEVPESELAAALAKRAELLPALRAAGYAQIALDLAGLDSGGFNRLGQPARPGPRTGHGQHGQSTAP